jgi:hypothetical protein
MRCTVQGGGARLRRWREAREMGASVYTASASLKRVYGFATYAGDAMSAVHASTTSSTCRMSRDCKAPNMCRCTTSSATSRSRYSGSMRNASGTVSGSGSCSACGAVPAATCSSHAHSSWHHWSRPRCKSSAASATCIASAAAFARFACTHLRVALQPFFSAA